MVPSNNDDRRRHPRIPLTFVSVDIFSATGKAVPAESCPIANISEGGMKICGDSRFEPGQIIRLTFTMPGSVIAMRTQAVVLHYDTEGNPPGYGLQFHNLGIAERTLLRVYISRALQKSYQRDA